MCEFGFTAADKVELSFENHTKNTNISPSFLSILCNVHIYLIYLWYTILCVKMRLLYIIGSLIERITEMIKISHLVKNYGNFTAVDDISFEVAKGEVL